MEDWRQEIAEKEVECDQAVVANVMVLVKVPARLVRGRVGFSPW